MATITAVEDQGNFSEPLLVTGEPVVMSDPVASATKDLESDTMPLLDGVCRDGLFGGFNNGCCSPVFWLCLGWCCNPTLPLILVADTMMMMRLEPDYKNTSMMVFVVCLNVIVMIARIYAYSLSVLLAHNMKRMRVESCGPSGGDYEQTIFDFFVGIFALIVALIVAFDAYVLFVLKSIWNNLSTAFWVFYYIEATFDFVLAIYIFVFGIRMRSAIHQKLNIPVGKRKGAEDCCCMC